LGGKRIVLVLLHESGAAVFFCPKFGAVGKKYLVFAGLRWWMIELYKERHLYLYLKAEPFDRL